MGQNESSFRKTYAETVSDLSSVQLSEIHARFQELYDKAGGCKGVVVDREAFSNYLNVPVTVGDRLFEAFDKKKNGSICMEEFVCGLAIVLHGSFRDRCSLLFSVFNLGNDEGVSRAELGTMLTAIMQSTNTILYSVRDQDSAVMGSQDIGATVEAMVESAFTNCDISRTGKLLPMEFEYWLKRNPKVLDSLLSFQTKSEECTLGRLIMSPSEQAIGGVANTASSWSSQQGSVSSLTSSSSQQQKKRSPFSIRRLSKDKGKETPSSPSISSKMFQVGSIDSLSTQEGGATSSLNSGVLHSVSMDTDGPGGMASAQDSLNSLGLGVSTMEVGSEQGSLVQQPIPEVRQSSSEVSLEISATEPEVQLTDDVGEGLQTSVGRASSLVGPSDISLEEESAANQSVLSESFRVSLEGDPGTVPSGGDVPSSSSLVGMATCLEAVSSVPLVDQVEPTETAQTHQEGEKMGKGVGGLNVSGPVNLEEGMLAEDIAVGGVAAGNLINADSALLLDLSRVPRVEGEENVEPLSPILPVTSVEMGIEAKEGVEPSMVEVLEEGVAKAPGGVGSGVPTAAVFSQQSTGQEGVAYQAPPPYPGLDDPSLKVPPVVVCLPGKKVGRVSPLMDEWEGQTVREELHQGWVLSEVTRNQLENPSRHAHKLTCPALMSDIKLSDGISELLSQHYPDRPRKQLLSCEQVSMDTAGLRRLVSSGSLFAALELTGRFLSAHGQGLGQVGQPTLHTHKTLQMWSARVSLLIYLKLYNEAERELDAFGELTNLDLYYQYHSKAYPGVKGSMVPFTLRLMHANLPRHTGKVQLALDRLCTLQHTCQQILKDLTSSGRLPDHEELSSEEDLPVAMNIWKDRLNRVKCGLGNTLVHLQDYAAAARLYNQLAEEDEENKCEYLSLIGRLYLQLGDLKTAQQYFDKVKVHLGDQAESMPLVHLNNGFASVFLSQWQTAMDHFQTALSLDPANHSTQSNISVCKFYMGQLKESIGDMEHLLTMAPPTSLQPAVFANLANSYELESGSSFNKKLSFLPLLGQHVGQGYQHLPQLNLK